MLPTQKLYQAVDRTQYEAIKQSHINALSGGYSQLPNRDKWQALMEKFVISMPNNSAEVRAFCQARLDTVEGSGNISLADCISYFEQFYFLYTTTDPLFKINDAEKSALKSLLLDGMGYACEPGKQERFELALALYRRDTNWINGRLSQARYHVLEGLAERYNRALGITLGFTVHTIKCMKGLAEAKQLGIDREAALTDIYINGVERERITQYFTSHYRAYFHAYEACAADDLSQQLLNEFTDFLREKVNTTRWDQEGIIIPYNLIPEFNLFFENKSFDAVMDDLRDDSDEDNLKLKKKADFMTGLRSLIKKKLLENGYYASIVNLHALPSRGLPALPTWHGGVSMQDIVSLAKILENPSVDLSAISHQYVPVLLQYPGIVLARVETRPEILLTFPHAFRSNNMFINSTFTAVNAALLTAIETGDDRKIERLIMSFLTFLPSTYGDFSQLSAGVLNHPLVAHALVKRDGLLLKNMPAELKDNRAIVTSAIEQNSLALCFASPALQRNTECIGMSLHQLELRFGAFRQVEALNLTPCQARVMSIYRGCRSQLPEPERDAFQLRLVQDAFNSGHPDLIHAVLKAIEKMDALRVLYGADPVSALKLASLAQRVTPAELLMIVQYRHQNNFSPLPYCDHLEAFDQELRTAGIVWAADGYWAAKCQAQEMPGIETALHEASAVGYLARTHHWYMALVLHHHANQLAFQTWAQFFKQLQKTMEAAVQSLAAMLTLSVLTVAGIVAAESIALLPLLPSVGLSLLMALAVEALFGAAIAGSPLCILMMTALLSYCLYDVTRSMIRRSQEYIRTNIHPFFEDLIRAQWTQLCDSMHAVATHLYALIAGVFATVFSPAPPLSMDTLAERCERSIERLLFTKEDASAHQKGALLAALWDKVLAEGPCDSEVTLNARLNKQYEVTYQGQRRLLSFAEVAATKRVHSNRFNLDEPPSIYGFFSNVRATTSDSMLEPRPVMEPAA